MQSRSTVVILSALTIGLSLPIDRFDALAYRSQGVARDQVQSSCPTLSDLAAGPSTLLTMSAPVDRVWAALGDALRMWSKTARPDSASRLRKDAALITEQEADQSFEQRPVYNTIGRTCFFEWRTGNRNDRIAFKFSARPVPGKKTSTALELRWLSQTKGSAQRTWRASAADPSALRDTLVQLLRSQLRTNRRSP